MKYPSLGLIIENRSDSKNFILDIIHYSTDDKSFEVVIDNINNQIERVLLEFTNSNEKILDYNDITMIIPREHSKTFLNVGKDNPAIYTIIGKKIDAENHILLELHGITYLFNKNEVYFLRINGGNITSNKIELIFT